PPVASKPKKRSDGVGPLSARPRALETETAELGKPMALTAQLLQFPAAECVAHQFVRVAGRVQRGAKMPLQHAWTDAVATQDLVERFHGGAVERDLAQDQRVYTAVARLTHQLRGGILRDVAMEQRRAQRAVGMRPRQCRQAN